MSYQVEFSKEFSRIFAKIQKKNRKQSEIILKKIQEIKENPTHYKPLSNRLKGYWRVHIDSHFVLVFKLVGEIIVVIDFDHHDIIYEKEKLWKQREQ